MVLFCPDWGRLRPRLSELLSVSKQLVVYDNTPLLKQTSEHQETITKLNLEENIHVIKGVDNDGICKAYNEIVSWVKAYGFEWVLTLDQDTDATSDFIQRHIRCSSQYCKDNPGDQIGLFAPSLDLGGGLLQNGGESTQINVNEDSKKKSKVVEAVMSAGCLINLSAFEEIGGFDEAYWLDCFDHDFCFSLKRANFKCILHQDVVLTHSLGNLSKINKWYLRSPRYTSNHPAWRRRLIARNRRLLWGKFPEESDWISFERNQEKHEILGILLFEKNSIHKLWSIFCGMIDYKKGYRGKPKFNRAVYDASK